MGRPASNILLKADPKDPYIKSRVTPLPALCEPITNQCCIFCKSFNIVRDGVRHNKYADLQKYNCRQCNHYFTINLGFEKMHATP